MHVVHALIVLETASYIGCDDAIYDKGRRRHPKQVRRLEPPLARQQGCSAQSFEMEQDDRLSLLGGDEQPSCLAQGVPLRLELGMKDVEKRSVMVARRDTGAKEVVPFADMAARVPALLEQIQVRTCSQRIVCCMDGTSRYCYQ
jgi:hypothetical protein